MMSKKVALIHASNKILNKKDNLYTNESLTPSLGLAMIAAVLRKNGFSPAVFDLRLEHVNIEHILDFIKKENPLFVGFSAFTNEIISSAKCAEIIKNNFPKTFIVAGGPHPTLMPENTLKEFKDFDMICIGEGEEMIMNVARALRTQNKKNLERVENAAFRKKGKIILNLNPQRLIEDLNRLPFPAWDLFEIRHYNRIFVVSTSRGCPYHCYFCSPMYLGKRVRLRSAENVVDEIDSLVKKFNAKRLQFADAALNVNTGRTERMCELLVKKNLNSKIEWDCETRADNLNEKTLSKMKRAGCKYIAIGVESGSSRLLKDVINKGETKEQIKRGVKLIKKAGIKVRCFFILGHYSESEKEIKETIKFAIELKPDSLSFGLLVPNPGSEVRKMAEEGLGGMKILNNNWSNYNQFNYDCYEQGNIPIAELKKWQAKAYWTFYLHNPLKGAQLFFESSSYNYKIKSLVTLPIQLLKRLVD